MALFHARGVECQALGGVNLRHFFVILELLEPPDSRVQMTRNINWPNIKKNGVSNFGSFDSFEFFGFFEFFDSY